MDADAFDNVLLLFETLGFLDPTASPSPIPTAVEDGYEDDEGADARVVVVVVVLLSLIELCELPLLFAFDGNCDGARFTNEKASILPLMMHNPTSLFVMKLVNSSKFVSSRYFILAEDSFLDSEVCFL